MTRVLLSALAFLSVLSQAAPVDPATRAAGEILAGAVDYKGGFSKLELPIAVKDIVRSIRVGIPKFCKDVEILELGTITEGVYDEADLANEADRIYSVNQGAGLRISSVRLTLNGPSTAQCSIPLFLSAKKAAPADPEEQGFPIKANVCNRSRQQASLVLGYYDKAGELNSKGWWTLARGQCEWITVYGNPAGGLFLYGRTPSGSFWGKGHAQLCVIEGAFQGGKSICLEKSGHTVPATQLTPAFDNNYYLDLL